MICHYLILVKGDMGGLHAYVRAKSQAMLLNLLLLVQGGMGGPQAYVQIKGLAMLLNLLYHVFLSYLIAMLSVRFEE